MAGITYRDEELTNWIERLNAGNIYFNWGDEWTNSPPALSEQISLASTFISNPSIDYVDWDINVTPCDSYGAKALAAAFIYLLSGNTTYGTAVHDFLVSQVQEPTVDYSQYSPQPSSSVLAFTNWWTHRLFMIYDYTIGLYSVGEKTIIEDFFQKAAVWFRDSLHERVLRYRWSYRIAHNEYTDISAMIAGQGTQINGKSYWAKSEDEIYVYNGVSTGSINDYTLTNVAARDYSVKLNEGIGFADNQYNTRTEMFNDQGSQLNGDNCLVWEDEKMWTYQGTSNGNITDYVENPTALYEDPSITSSYTYVDKDGIGHNNITVAGKLYSNRNMSMGSFVGVWGAYTNNQVMIEHSKVLIEEWLKFHVFSDGTVCEATRNGDYSNNPTDGSLGYNTSILESVLRVAHVLWDKGDDSLFTYNTSDGLYGTQGGIKTIKTPIDSVCKHCVDTLTTPTRRYYLNTNDVNLQDTLFEFSTGNWSRRNPEGMVAYANRYYDDNYYKTIYRLEAIGSIPYQVNYYYPIGNSGGYWNGSNGWTPAVALTYYDMNPLQYPIIRKINKKTIISY